MFSGCIDVRLAGVDVHYLNPPSDIKMRIPDDIVKCVGFISHDLPEPDYLGTVFIVAVTSETSPNKSYLHIVTAKHVAEMIDPGPFAIGMNAKDGTRITLKSGDDTRWWYHPTDASVDVAVTPFAPSMFGDYDVRSVPDKAFATDELMRLLGIGLGDQIFTVGLFTKFFGSSKFIPIVRTGNIAMMPTEKVRITGLGRAEVYLAEGRSIGGLSGSPVFVRPTVELTNAKGDKGEPLPMIGIGRRLAFLGLMHGHWDLPLPSVKEAEAVNMGVSIIIPAKKIMEVLYHPELVEMRRELDRILDQSNLPTADTAKKPQFTRADFETALKKVSRKVAPRKK